MHILIITFKMAYIKIHSIKEDCFGFSHYFSHNYSLYIRIVSYKSDEEINSIYNTILQFILKADHLQGNSI